MKNLLVSRRLYSIIIAFIIFVLWLFVINANNTTAAQGEDPRATLSVEKGIVGSGLQPGTGVYLTEANGFVPGYTGKEGNILASYDDISYIVSLEIMPGPARKITYNLQWPEYLKFNKAKSADLCKSNAFITNSYVDVNENNRTVSCSFSVKNGIAASFSSNAIFVGADTAGKLEGNQIVKGDIGIGVSIDNPTYVAYSNTSAPAISVISAPMADLMIKPSQCDIYGNCSPSTSDKLTGSFDLLVNPLRYPGYNNTFGATSMTPWTAQIDVSDFPAGTVWTLADGTVLPVVDGKISIPSTSGNSKVNFKVPNQNWGGSEFEDGEVRSYDVHLIVPDTAFATEYYQNNGNGWEPGQNQGKDEYTQKDKDAGARKGWYYANNDWTKYVVTQSKPGQGQGGEVSKTIYRPWSTNQTLWESGNMVIDEDESNLTAVPNLYVNCKPQEMCVNQVAAGTEFIAQLFMNGSSIKNPQSDVVFTDTWNSDEVDVISLNSIEGKLGVKNIEWLVGKQWQASSTAIPGSSAIRVTYDKADFPEESIVRVQFQVKKDLSSSVNVISDQVGASFTSSEGNQLNYGPIKAQLIPSPEPLKKLNLDVRVSPEILDNAKQREAVWTYSPVVSGFLNSKDQVVENPVFTIDLDPAIFTFDLLSNQYEIVSLELGNFDANNPGKNTPGKVVLKLKSGNYVGNTENGVLKLPQIKFATKTAMLAKGSTITSMRFDAYDKNEGLFDTAQASVLTTDPIVLGSALYPLTPKEERDEPLKYQYFQTTSFSNASAYENSETVIILPTNDKSLNNAYLNALKQSDPNYNKETSSNFKGTYTTKAEVVGPSSVDGTKLMCTTEAKTSLNPKDYNWQELSVCNNTEEVTAYKVIVPPEKDQIATINFTFDPQGNAKGDNYLLWASSIYTDGKGQTENVINPMIRPENEVIVASNIEGYVYWDISKDGTVWDKNKEGISSEEYPEMKLQLLDSKGNQVYNENNEPYFATTDENGYYQFQDVKSGDYSVKIIDAPKFKDSNFYKENDEPKKIKVAPSYVYYNKRGIPINNEKDAPTQAVNQKGVSTEFNVKMEEDFGLVNFGFFGPDPYTNIMKKPSKVECVGDELQCDIQWDIFIKGGTSDLIPGSIKLMYVQGDVNTIVVTDTDQVYIWGVDLGEYNIGVTETATPIKIDTSVIAEDETITQITGSYSMFTVGGTRISSPSMILLTESSDGQNIYGLGNGLVYGGNKFGTGSTSSYPELTNITTSTLKNYIESGNGIKTIQSDSNNTVILTNDGKAYISGGFDDLYGRNWVTNTYGTPKTTWVPINIVNKNGDNVFDTVKIKKIVSSNWTTGIEAGDYSWNNISNTITAIDVEGNLYTAGTDYKYGSNEYGNGMNKKLIPLTLNDYISDIKDFRNYYDSNIAISNSGDIYVWGKNKNGMLGNGQTSGLQVTPIKLSVNFAANKFLTSNNSFSNTCNIIEDTNGQVHAAGQCVLPSGKSINSSTFTDISSDFSTNDDANLTNFVVQKNNALALNKDGLLLPSGSPSDNSYYNASYRGGYVYTNGSYYPTGLPTDTEDGTNFVNGPWIEKDGQIIGKAGSVDITDLVFTDNVSSEVYDVKAQLYLMKSTEINPNETDLGIISANSTNTLDNNYTSRTYNLPTLEKDYMFKVVFSGKVNKKQEGYTIGNQAWISSAEIPRVAPTMKGLPAFDEANPLANGKWTGNEATKCGVNTDWTVQPDVQDNCDQVFGSVPGSGIPLGSLGGMVFWDKAATGSFASGDIKIPNVPVYLLTENGDLIDNTLTDNNGAYLFDGLNTSLKYQVSFQLPSQTPKDLDPAAKAEQGWRFTTQASTDCTSKIGSCVTLDGLTSKDLEVEAKAKSIVGNDTVNAGVITVAPGIEVTKGTGDINNLEQDIKAKYDTDYPVSVKVTNIGNEPLQSFIFSDQTNNGSDVAWDNCKIGNDTISIKGGTLIDGQYYIEFPNKPAPAPENTPYQLAVNDTMECSGDLTGLKSKKDNHNDTISVTGFGGDTGIKVAGSSDFNAVIDEDTIPKASISIEKGILNIDDNTIDPTKKLFDIDKNYTITFRVKNDGHQDILKPEINDVTNNGPQVTDIACYFPLKTITNDQDEEEIVTYIKSGESADCTGTLNLNQGKMEHKNTVDAKGYGELDGKEVNSNEAIFEAHTLTQVEPVVPTLNENVDCDQDYQLVIPTVEGIEYTQSWNGKVVTITATATEGYVIKDGFETVWTFDTANKGACAVVVEPTLDKDVECEENYKVIVPDESDSVRYEVNTIDFIVTVEAIAKDGFEFKPNTQTKWVFNIKNETTCAVIVEPTLDTNVDCDQDYKVIVPEDSDSVEYKMTTNGKEVTVTASAKEGYAFEPNATTEWTFDTTNKEACAVVVEPTLDKNVECDEDYKVIVPDENDSVRYEKIVNDQEVTIKAIAKEGYEFKPNVTTEWTFNIKNETSCAIIIEPTLDKDVECDEDYKVIVPEDSDSVEYKVTTKGKEVTVTASAKEGYAFEPNATTEWTFNIANAVSCAIVAEPILDTDVDCEKDYQVLVPSDNDTVKYEVARDGNIVTVKAIVQDGYVIKPGIESEWTFDVTNTEICVVLAQPTLDKDVECEKDYNIIIPETDGVNYVIGDKVDGKVKVTAKLKDGYGFKPDTVTEWTFDVSNSEKCPVDTTNPVIPLPTTGSNDIIYAVFGLALSLISGIIFIRKSVNVKL